jgi:hypothetical protein
MPRNLIAVDALVRGANPVTPAAAAALRLDAVQQELRELIVREGPPWHATLPQRPRSAPRARGRLVVCLALSAAAVIAAMSLGGVFSAGRPAIAWAAELVHFAEASPLVLLEQPGWQVNYANEDSANEGEIHFAGPASAEAALYWRSGSLTSWMADRAASADLTTTASVLGTTAHVYQYAGGRPGDEDITALWEYGGSVLEFRTGIADVAAFEALLGSLRQVDVNTWLSALPSSVVTTAGRTAAIASMLQGVALPPGFDPSTVTGSGLTSDRYQLGATVVGTVACTWFKRWSDGRASGNASEVQQAIAALATAKDWPIINQMSSEGAYPQVLEAFAAAMPSGHWYGRPLAGDVDSGLGCPRLGLQLAPSVQLGAPSAVGGR